MQRLFLFVVLAAIVVASAADMPRNNKNKHQGDDDDAGRGASMDAKFPMNLPSSRGAVPRKNSDRDQPDRRDEEEKTSSNKNAEVMVEDAQTEERPLMMSERASPKIKGTRDVEQVPAEDASGGSNTREKDDGADPELEAKARKFQEIM